MAHFEERLGFGEKEPGILVTEIGIDMTYGKNKKLFLNTSKNRGHQILFNKFKKHKCIIFLYAGLSGEEVDQVGWGNEEWKIEAERKASQRKTQRRDRYRKKNYRQRRHSKLDTKNMHALTDSAFFSILHIDLKTDARGNCKEVRTFFSLL